MAKIFRPPPPKTTGIKSLVILFTLVGWGGWIVWQALTLPDAAKTASQPTPRATPDPGYVEIDLRGPFYDQGRYAGYQEGLAAADRGSSLPAETVLDFQGNQQTPKAADGENDKDDFVVGYRSGYTQAWKANREKIAKAQSGKIPQGIDRPQIAKIDADY